jgi:hypothetical protein
MSHHRWQNCVLGLTYSASPMRTLLLSSCNRSLVCFEIFTERYNGEMTCVFPAHPVEERSKGVTRSIHSRKVRRRGASRRPQISRVWFGAIKQSQDRPTRSICDVARFERALVRIVWKSKVEDASAKHDHTPSMSSHQQLELGPPRESHWRAARMLEDSVREREMLGGDSWREADRP